MIGRRSLIGIAMLCALALSAIGAASASALEYQTAVKCKKTGTGFSDAHCKTASGSGPYSHVEIPPITEKEFSEGKGSTTTATNGETGAETKSAETVGLHGTVAGVETDISCAGLSGTGQTANTANDAGSGKMSAMGTGTIVFSGCTVVKPSGQGCVVTGGSISTATLFSTTFGQAANKVKVAPNSGTTFATVPISGCSTSALNNNFPVTGTLVLTASGATLTTTREGSTTQNTLKFGGNKAGIKGSLTVRMKEGEAITLT